MGGGASIRPSVRHTATVRSAVSARVVGRQSRFAPPSHEDKDVSAADGKVTSQDSCCKHLVM